MCLYSKLIKNKKYEPNKKNGGVIPAVSDIRTTFVAIGCGDCIECRKQKAREWAVRLQEEIRTKKNGKFVTLTFSTKAITNIYKKIEEEDDKKQWEAVINYNEIPEKRKGYTLDNAAATYAIRHFLERWRKKYKKSVRHWLITEIGGNNWEHIHIHGIIWTDEKIEPIWQYGGVYIGKYREGNEKNHWVNDKTVNYIVKYLNKIDIKHKTFKSKILCSAGIGANYMETENSEINKFKGDDTKETYTTYTGEEIALPIYLRNKIYTEEEREKLWIIKLNKNERYVCGEKIEVDFNNEKSIHAYYDLLEYHRNKSFMLGYGNNTTWKSKEYEKAQRQIMIKKRKESDTNKSIGYTEAWKEQKANRDKLIKEWNSKHA